MIHLASGGTTQPGTAMELELGEFSHGTRMLPSREPFAR